MSEHAWVLENVASYVADGLEPVERERLELHVASCQECARAVHEARALDHTIGSLFTGIRPGPELEDRIIRSLRTAAQPRLLRLSFHWQLALGAAAVLLLGVLGVGTSSLIEQGNLPFPGTWGTRTTLLADSGMTLPRGGRYASEAEVIPQHVDDLARETRERAISSLGAVTAEIGGGERLARSRDGQSNAVTLLERDTTVNEFARYAQSGNASHFAGGLGGSPARAGMGIDLADIADKNGDGLAAPVDGRANSGWAVSGAGQADDTRHLYSRALTLSKELAKEPQQTGAELKQYYVYRNDQQVAKVDAKTELSANPAAPVHFKPADLATATAAVQPQGPSAAPQADTRKEPGSDSQPATNRGPTETQQPNQPTPAVTGRKVVRSGDIEFEVESFDLSVDKISQIAGEESGFVATVNSEKLPNGKVRGSVVVRVPPERLDTLVLKLRALGEVKSQKIGSQDITKQYTDLESRLRAARAMEERLLEMIKTGNGEIKDLLQAEKELGVWRTKIEEIEGELRYYTNLVSLSTLTITLVEKEIRAPFAITETERVQMGVEVEDVEQAHRDALSAISEAEGRVTKSELKQHAAGQFSAVIHFDVAPEAAGPLRDRLRQLGHVARLEVDRLQQTEGGTGRPRDARFVRNDTQFLVSLYNVTNVAPRETVQLNLACVDTEGAYKTILDRVERAAGRVVSSTLNRQANDTTTGSIQFEVKAADADAVLADVKVAGEVMRLQVTENPDAQNVTRSKRGFNVQLWSMGQVAPRETTVLQLASRDVPAGYRLLQEAVLKAKGRILNAQLNEQDKQDVTAQLDFDIPRTEEAALAAAMSTAGEMFSRNVVRAQESENVIDSKVRLQVSLIFQARIPPRETITLGMEVDDVDKTATLLAARVAESKGRTVESHLARERSGRMTAKLVFDVPLATASALVDKFKAFGIVRAQQSARNPQVPDGDLAIARLDVTLSNAELIVPHDEGIWSQIRKGLSTSFIAISWSLIVVIVGLSFVLPWTLLIYAIYKIVTRMRRKALPAA